jgi:hypothetical protein
MKSSSLKAVFYLKTQMNFADISYMSLNSSEFLENEFSERHTLLKGINDILPIFNTCSRFEQKIGIGFRKNWWSDCEFGKNRPCESSTC